MRGAGWRADRGTGGHSLLERGLPAGGLRCHADGAAARPCRLYPVSAKRAHPCGGRRAGRPHDAAAVRGGRPCAGPTEKTGYHRGGTAAGGGRRAGCAAAALAGGGAAGSPCGAAAAGMEQGTDPRNGEGDLCGPCGGGFRRRGDRVRGAGAARRAGRPPVRGSDQPAGGGAVCHPRRKRGGVRGRLCRGCAARQRTE